MGEADQAKHCFAPPNAEARRAQAGPERSEGEPSTNGLSQTARPLIRGWWAVMGEADQAKHCFAPPNAEARRAQAGPERSEGEPSTNGLSQTARPLIRGWWAVMGEADQAKHCFAPPKDGKSVVEGKSVSVSVDRGGCRIIKKKKQRSKQNK